MASVCACGDYFNVSLDGELCLNPGTMGLREIMYFNTPGADQFRKSDYPWLARIRVKVQAAGGGSGGARASANELISRPGGAGGGYSESLLTVDELGAVESVVVGAGGVGGVGNDPGTAGGDSSFGGIVTALGGGPGTANMTSGTSLAVTNGISGPVAGMGQFVQGGGAGEGSFRLNGSSGLSGAGGDSMLGFGGWGRSTTGVGGTSRGYGGGASGAFSVGEANNGTVGGNGMVIVELYG
ncbi:glycine-rich domain-containing protein [Streptomyces niveus]|uniref:glycine-rich domain-containing protein n=1 Tax=Streptomyces niveus TaxID=193462 RepID=UPI0036B69FC4